MTDDARLRGLGVSILRSEPSTLVIGQAQASTAELLTQQSVLLDEASMTSACSRFTWPANSTLLAQLNTAHAPIVLDGTPRLAFLVSCR